MPISTIRITQSEVQVARSKALEVEGDVPVAGGLHGFDDGIAGRDHLSETVGRHLDASQVSIVANPQVVEPEATKTGLSGLDPEAAFSGLFLIGNDIAGDGTTTATVLAQAIFDETNGKLSEALECWGHSVDKDDIEYQAVHQHCKSHDRIYVDEQLQIGEFFYNYEWIDTDTLNRFQFYTFLQERFEHIQLHSSDDEEQVEEYSCETALVDLSSGSWKVSTCQRGYKKHPGLYDALLVMALVDFPDHSAIIKAGASGISKDNARALYRTMMEDVRWAR